MRRYAYLNVSNPWVAWLVYRGEMVSAGTGGAGESCVLSLWHASYIQSIAEGGRLPYYAREAAIEIVRKSVYPSAVSRLTGMYFFEDRETACRIGRQWWSVDFREEFVAGIEIKRGSKCSRHDSMWISQENHPDGRDWIGGYLRGMPAGDCPAWEVLVEGRGLVLDTDIRKRAYQTVERRWPRSLGLLELSRLAVEVGSDLGVIRPLLTRGSDGSLRLAPCMDFRDAENPEFLRRLAEYRGPLNRQDLNTTVNLIQPDLRDEVVEIPAGAAE